MAIASATRVLAGNRDFDFFFGRWKVHNRRLAKRLAGCEEWQEFEATCECQPILGGWGNMDEYRTHFWPNFVGCTLRLYDPVAETWSIYWLDTRNSVGVLQPPVVGRFRDRVGVFEAHEEFEGRPIIVRFTWDAVDAERPRWEQAFSPDGGKTWETNWVNQFVRADASR
jgi:hypothetical protein